MTGELSTRVTELERLVQEIHHFHSEDLLKLQKEHDREANSLRGDIELLSHRLSEQVKYNNKTLGGIQADFDFRIFGLVNYTTPLLFYPNYKYEGLK